MTTILRYGCATLLALTFARAGADDRSAAQLLPSWSGVIPSPDHAAGGRGATAPTIEMSASTSADDLPAGAEQLASWSGEIPEISGDVDTAAAAPDAGMTLLPSWSGVIPSVSGR